LTDRRFEPAAPFTSQDIDAIESTIGRPLPAEYRNFVSEYGGAFVGGLVDGSQEFPILRFFEAAKILANLRSYDDLLEEKILPVARDESGNLYVIDIGGAVHFIIYYGGTTTTRKVGISFEDVVARISVVVE
jgi:hypothetical protein